MSQQIAERRPDPVDQIVQQVRSESFREQLEAALPENVSADRFARVTVTAVRENPDVVKYPDSLFAAVVRCAQDGLLPNGNEAALVVFGGNNPGVVYLAMIGGLRKIASEHGWSIRTQAIHENDEFAYELGDTPRIVHRPALRERGEVIAAYAIGVHRDGRTELEVMNREEIEKVRATSRAKNGGPWVDWFERMAEKTVGRRLFKKLPLDDADRARVARVIAASELGAGESAALLYGEEARAALEPGATLTAPERGEMPVPPREAVSPDVVGAADADASAPATDFDGEEPPAPEEEAAPQQPTGATDDDSIVFAAGEVVFNKGRHQGRTIRQVHEEQLDGDYLAWAMRSWKTEPIKSAVTTYVHERLPELVK